MILSFLHRVEDMSFHDEILQVRRKHVYVHRQKNSEFWNVLLFFMIFLFDQEHMSSGSKVNFRWCYYLVQPFGVGKVNK